MSRFTDAALLKGDYAKMLKEEPPKEAEWKKASCENTAEAVAQSVAKQIFAMRQNIDPKTTRLEVSTFSSLGPVKVMGIVPLDGDLMRIDGILPAENRPVALLQHTNQLSLTFNALPLATKQKKAAEEVDDDGLQIGFVIFDELKERKKKRDSAKKKKTTRKPAAKKRVPKK